MASNASPSSPLVLTPPQPETASSSLRNPIFSRIRIANSSDVPHLQKLMYQMAVYHGFTHLFSVTESSLSATLFNNSPPFQCFTVFLLEVSPTPFPDDTVPVSRMIVNVDDHLLPIVDPEWHDFRSSTGGREAAAVVVVGFALFCPRYGMLLEKPGFHIEGLYVRKGYRKIGFGKMLLSAVAAQALKMGYEEVDWVVFNWNGNAIEFYKKMGAEIHDQTKTCRLTLDALQACGTLT